jgi:serine/threonine-protein kinase RsbT
MKLGTELDHGRNMTSNPGVACIRVATDSDIVVARRTGRDLAEAAGFTGTDLTMISTAISEVARNIVAYAAPGEIIMTACREPQRRGITLIARDKGPGIKDLGAALRDGVSTGNGLGLGLPGARRLMDEFGIHSTVGEGTTITMTKWCSSHRRITNDHRAAIGRIARSPEGRAPHQCGARPVGSN